MVDTENPINKSTEALGRFTNDDLYGRIGRLTYVPQDLRSEDAPEALISTRVTGNIPAFRVICPFEEWYPAVRAHVRNSAVDTARNSRRAQKRWLLLAHPEAYMGSAQVDSLLVEEKMHSSNHNTGLKHSPLLSIGSIWADNPSARRSTVSVLASVTGESGEVLRLAKLETTVWEWSDKPRTSLRVLGIDSTDREGEAFWSRDRDPISQIKFVLSVTPQRTIRWLLLQTMSSTTILQPEYHSIPVSQQDSQKNTFSARPSRIDPKPLGTFHRSHTGGNAHSDFSFKPQAQGEVPQLAIIDVCGYWSVWNLVLSLSEDKVRIFRASCGHIESGLLNDLPVEAGFRTEPHGLLWISPPANSFASSTGTTSHEPGPGSANQVSRSNILVLWNRTLLEAMRLDGGKYKPAFPILHQKQVEWILDVQACPLDGSRIFVLTSSTLFWIRILFTQTDEQLELKFIKLFSYSHGRDPGDETLRLAVHDERDQPIPEWSLVTIYSSQDCQIDICWFGVSTVLQEPLFHHQITYFTGNSPDNPEPPRTLSIIGVKLADKRWVEESGSPFADLGLRFQQIIYVGEDLSILSSIGAISAGGTFVASPAEASEALSRYQSFKQRQRTFFQRFQEVFVVPDGLAELDKLVHRDLETGRESVSDISRPVRRETALLAFNFRKLWEALAKYQIKPVATEDDGSSTLTNNVRGAVKEALEEDDQMPLRMLQEFVEPLSLPPAVGGNNEDMGSQLPQLFELEDERVQILSLSRSNLACSDRAKIEFADFLRHLLGIWFEKLPQIPDRFLGSRQSAILEAAWACTLSAHGIIIQNEEAVSQERDSHVEEVAGSKSFRRQRSLPAHSEAEGSQTQSSFDLRPPSSSQMSTLTSTSSAEASEKALDAIRRLQLLAVSLPSGKAARQSQHSVLSRWPAERGQPVYEYISSVAEAGGKHLEVARRRKEKAEARRQRREEKYRSVHRHVEETLAFASQPAHSLPNLTLPSLRPEPSQSQGFSQLPPPSQTMSQPIPGAFAIRTGTMSGRSKASSGKRKKGGFR